jgi:hypothetical protein
MKRTDILSLLLLISAMIPLTALGGDFDWLSDLNLKARTNLTDFRATLDTRFRIGDAEARLVLSNVDQPGDGYMVLRLSELSQRPVAEVLKVYQADHGKGWGVIARHLGIKPGSRAFHALKRGHDLGHSDNGHGGGAMGKARGKGKHNG